MTPLPAARLDIQGLQVMLAQRIAALGQPVVVADAMRVFLEVSSLASERGLWSLEFAFDEEDARTAVMQARFWDSADPAPAAAELPGYEVQLAMPRLIPVTSVAARQKAADHVRVLASARGALVTRFITALNDLGAYRTVEAVLASSADVHRL